MAGQVRVVWQSRAIAELRSAVAQGRFLFGERVAARFYYNVKAYDLRLVFNPYLGQRIPELDTPRRQIRSLAVHEHYKLIYYVNEEKQKIYIVSFWDVRRDPHALTIRVQGKKP